MFKNRTEAGKQLAQRLLKYRDKEVVVVAIPRGGLPLGASIAEALSAPLDVVFTKKIGHPLNKEFAIGAVSLEHRFITDSMDHTSRYIDEETKRVREILQQRRNLYYKNFKPIDLRDKIVIVVDDGLATGNTMLATITLIYEENPSQIIVAVPVASATAAQKIKDASIVDEFVCLHISKKFRSVGQFYTEFAAVVDALAVQILEDTNACIQ